MLIVPGASTHHTKIARCSGLNKWLGDLIGQPETLQLVVHYDLDNATHSRFLFGVGFATYRSCLSDRRSGQASKERKAGQ